MGLPCEENEKIIIKLYITIVNKLHSLKPFLLARDRS